MVTETINNTEKELLIKRSAVRTMAKDIKSLSENATSRRQEEFLSISEDKEITKPELNRVVENKKLLIEKKKIENLINSLSLSDSFKKSIKVEDNQASQSVDVKSTIKEQAGVIKDIPAIEIDFNAPQREIKIEKKVVTSEKSIKEQSSVSEKSIKEQVVQAPAIEIDFNAPQREIKIEKPLKERIKDADVKIAKREAEKEKLKADLLPFENNKLEILKQIEKAKIELKDIKKQEVEIGTKKEEIEKREAIAQNEEKRKIEQERWSIEKQRDTIEKQRYTKEDEQKSLKLQLKEVDISADNILKKIKEKEIQVNALLKEKENCNLLLKKEEIEKQYSSLDGLYEASKSKLLENTNIKEKKEEELNEVLKAEKTIEEQVATLESAINATEDVIEKRKIEGDRREKEEDRKSLERKRWTIEDELAKIGGERKAIKDEYKSLMSKREDLEKQLEEIKNSIN
jgi:hypothetical protein